MSSRRSLLVLAVAWLAAAATAASDAPKVVSVPLTRRAKGARSAFAPPWHKRWAPEAPRDAAAMADVAPDDLAEQPLYGDLTTIGEYYVELPVGGQVINVQIDTGSSTLAVPLKQCLNCRPHDRRFDMSKAEPVATMVKCASDTCRPNTCHAYGRHGQCSACSKGTNACCSSVETDKCGFFLQYADGSGAAGALMEADVTLAGLTVPLVFGSILRVSKGFESVAVDGILGMAFASLACNPTCVTPLFDALVKAGRVERDVFSLCTGRHGGTMTLGGSNPDLFEGKLQYVPLSSKKVMHFYDVDITGVEVGGVSISVPDFTDGIVDSGTTVLVIAPRSYHGLKKYFLKHYCHVPGLCPRATHGGHSHASRAVEMIHVSPEQASLIWNQGAQNKTRAAAGGAKVKAEEAAEAEDDDYITTEGDGLTWFSPGYCALLSDADVAKLPSISIVLVGGVRLKVEAEDYMLRYEQPSRYPWNRIVFRCLGIAPLPGLGDMGNNVIIGDAWLQKFYVEYDRENMRVGFAPSKNCVQPGQELTPWLRNGKDEAEEALDGSRALSPSFLIALGLGSIVSWAIVIYLCFRGKPSEPHREQYRPIT
jgi:Eukaryotic aspartyl protease